MSLTQSMQYGGRGEPIVVGFRAFLRIAICAGPNAYARSLLKKVSGTLRTTPKRSIPRGCQSSRHLFQQAARGDLISLRSFYWIAFCLMTLIVGCGPNPNVQGKPAPLPKQNVAGEPGRPDAGGANLPAGQHGQIAPDAERPAARTPLIRGIGELLEGNPALEEDTKHPLREQLQQADEILSGIKDQNRSALKEINRQQRTRRSAAPNIVMFIINDLALSDLNCYGASAIQTPNIDRLATSGTRFTQFYAGSPNKSDAHWCLATGRRPDEASSWSNSAATLLPENITVAEAMWQAGYTTGVFGDWGGLGPEGPATPDDQGYDEWLGTFAAVDKSLPFPAAVTYNGRPIKFTKNANGQQGQSAQDFYVAEAGEFMARSYRQHPFFLQAYFAVDGATATAADREQYADQAWPEAAKSRAAALTKIDRDLGKLLQRLADLKQLGNTVLILTSDTPGPAVTETPAGGDKASVGLRGGPGELYEGALRIPLIVVAGGRIANQRECAAVSAAWDLAPTIYDLVAALKRPTHRAGQSLLPFLKANAALPTRFLQWERKHGTSEIAARWKNWKVVRPAGQSDFELYDLETDVAETRNVAAQHPDVLAEINKRLLPPTEQAKR